MKYKIGDKVEIIKLDDDSAVVKIGDTGIIDGIYDKGDYRIRVAINGIKDYGFNADEIKLVEDYSKKLTIEDIVELKKMVFDKIVETNEEMKDIKWKLDYYRKRLTHDNWKDWNICKLYIAENSERLEVIKNEIIKFSRLDNVLGDIKKEIN